MERQQAEWPARVERWREKATLLIVLAGAFALPLVFVRDPFDMFRMPKALLLRAEAILLAATTLVAWILGAPRPRLSPLLLMSLASFAGLIVLTMTSTNRTLSIEALGTVAATAIVFFSTVSAARRNGPILLAIPLNAALVNALLVILEEANIWMPFGVSASIPHHLQCTALIGNPNEIGGYLGAATLVCIAAVSQRMSRRGLVCVAVLMTGLVASRTLTALIALAVAGVVMVAMISWRKGIAATAAVLVAAGITVALVAPLRHRAVSLTQSLRTGDYNTVFTGRLTPFVAAWSMFVDHPLTGVGPGAFAWQFYDYKIRAEQRFPSLRQSYNRGLNFGEVHNDHLQVLAETGVFGYCAFAAFLAALAAISFRPAHDDAEPRLARRLALPLAVLWVVLALAQFPLETTVVRSLLMHLAALCVGWRR